MSVILRKSTNKDKKFMLEVENRKVHFGAIDRDWETLIYILPQ